MYFSINFLKPPYMEGSLYPWYNVANSHLTAHCSKPIIERQVSVERKDAVIRNAGPLGWRWTSVLKPTQRFCSITTVLKGERAGGNLSESWSLEVEVCIILCLQNWLTRSSDVILPRCSVCRIATWAFGGNELVIL